MAKTKSCYPVIEDVLLEPFSIVVESHCYAIHEKKLTRDKSGAMKEHRAPIRFPRTLELAEAWIVREKVRRRLPGAVSLREYHQQIIKEARDVKSVCDHV